MLRRQPRPAFAGDRDQQRIHRVLRRSQTRTPDRLAKSYLFRDRHGGVCPRRDPDRRRLQLDPKLLTRAACLIDPACPNTTLLTSRFPIHLVVRVTGLVGPLPLDPQRKGKSMNIRALLCTASLAVLITTPQAAVAQQGVKIGALRCEVSGGLGLIITSSKDCNAFSPRRAGGVSLIRHDSQIRPRYRRNRSGRVGLGCFCSIRRTQARSARRRLYRHRRFGDRRGRSWRERARGRLWPLGHVAALVGSGADRACSRRRRCGAGPSRRALNTGRNGGPRNGPGIPAQIRDRTRRRRCPASQAKSGL